ncbi:hypothetical protein [Flavobacterium muglaense]|uniref:Lipocalin-like domain-containing protein n=1 Tax=Flavobacterium muglaense TaxID=2764716 RepID=A0A923MZ68_9FLAO|nr:hypothetical protein [Flavobacterium muglaense]MBC5836534.1 hypothetical protein [Flavobacterium muglaense]MBC5843200.1 hypothetical protein [Flavobacterium muglaense]
MKKLISTFLLTVLLPTFMFCQDATNQTSVKTKTGIIKIEGQWEQLNTAEDSGQTYLKNKEGVIIAVAQNAKKSYPFFDSTKSNDDNLTSFYTWDSDYYKENNFKTAKLKENKALEYIIWKYNDNKADNVFLFASTKNSFLNLLVYTNNWPEAEKIIFLEKTYKLNK